MYWTVRCMIDVENLTRKFGNLTAVENLTLHVDEGEVFGFLGPNGAGKTTTVRMLCCLISKTSGKAQIGKYSTDTEADCMAIRKLVGLLPENVGLYDSLSAYLDSACGLAHSATGPFYCPADEKVYIDLGFYDELKQRFGAPGEFAQAYVLAHELGHHVQELIGIEEKVHAAQERNPRAANQLSVSLELQAFCLQSSA